MRYFITILAAFMLTACGVESLKELRYAELKGDAFQTALAEQYLAFAEKEAVRYDWFSMQHFADKGLRATYGHDVLPEDPSHWRLHGAILQDLQDARSMLLRQLTPDYKMNKPQEAATLQFSYDCWIEEQEEGWEISAIERCKERFYALLRPNRANKKPPAISTSNILYFPWDATEIDPKNRAILHDIATSLKDRNNVEIVINGHADRSGSDDYNMELSAQRAERIVDILARTGLARDKIRYFAFGETDPQIDTADGIREPANRRVEIFIE